jgi:predicted dienelactone hydrolase
MDYAPGIAELLVPLQIVFEGYRWQMLPSYIFTGLLFVLTLPRLLRRPAPTGEMSPKLRFARTFTILIGLLLLPVLAVPGILFPVPRLPDLSGPYQVGTVSFHLIDPSRDEIYTDDSSDSREIMVQMWYPAEPEEGASPAPYLPDVDAAGPAIAAVLDLPPFVLDHLDLVRTHSYPDADLSDAAREYPVLVFSHGLQGFRTQNTIQAEQFASHGYVVAAIDHTYACAVSVYPDGRVALFNPDVLSDDYVDADHPSGANRLVSMWAADISFLLDQLELLAAGQVDSPFEDRLDLEHIGVFGHSTGGGTAVQVCWSDSRCRAGLGMDAWLEPVSDQVVEDGLDQPFMFMYSETWSDRENMDRLDQIYGGLNEDGYLFTVLGTSHYDFADLPLLSPAAEALGLKGPIEGRRMLEIVQQYGLAFFDQHLRGQGNGLLEGPSADYPEVVFDPR